MPLEKVPRNPLAKNFRPTKSEPYRVRDGDNWKSVAAKIGVDVGLLIEFNFHTKDPREVNYYLRDRVGCVLRTPDGHNWRFSSAANPGIIYIPLQRRKIFLQLDGLFGSSIDPQHEGSIEAASFSFGRPGGTDGSGQGQSIHTGSVRTRGSELHVIITRPPASGRDFSRLQAAVANGRQFPQVVLEIVSPTDDDVTITLKSVVILSIESTANAITVSFEFSGGATFRTNP